MIEEAVADSIASIKHQHLQKLPKSTEKHKQKHLQKLLGQKHR